MFAFISKFLPQRSESAPESNRKKEPVSPLLRAEEETKNKEAERQAFLRRIDASINNEQALLELLLQCDFADGRLHAAQQIHSKEHLERVVKELRNSDKRVAKLMIQRLEKIQKKEALTHALQACVEQAQSLLTQECILANQVIALDKSFSMLDDLSPQEKLPFDQVRAQIAQQIDQQLQLQRKLLDLQHTMNVSAQETAHDFQIFVQQCEQQLADCCRSPYLASLPRHLMSEVQDKLRSLQALATQTTKVATLKTEEQVANEADVLETPAAMHKVMSRPETQSMTASLSLPQIEQALQQMEAALEQGSVQAARQFERELKEIDPKQRYVNLKLSPELKARLTAARKELSHLMSWAKWSGTVSRDELVATAEGLASLKLKPAEIVETVSALRAQWKQMEGGAAAKDLWERFDAACSAAYAPASEHFREQAELRKNNLNAAQAWLLECQKKLDALMTEPIVWKALQTTLFDMQQHWRGLGALDRKERLDLEKTYAAVCEAPAQALAQRQQQEQASRLALIAEVEALDATQKSSVDQLKAIQVRWQTQAASVPLKRKDEQSLWEQFRAACDAVFEEKRRHIESADQQRQANLVSKQTLCEQAEAVQLHDEKEVRAYLQQLNKAWQEVGAVPRQQEQSIEKRLDKIVAQLGEQGRTLTRNKQAQKMHMILQQTALCQQLEMQLCERDAEQIAVQSITEEWQQLGALSSQFAHVIQTRFDAGLAALNNGIEHYRETLATNRATFDDLILHLEILAGIDSPENLSRERLQKQVQVLQASMKSGNDQSQQSALFKQLLSVPVALDLTRQQRWAKLTEKLDLQLS
ncbi:MAG: DUF349 domain-containing protein [Burkholderiales bacterium]|nr:DUF349 domain-containing protein [Burkholderiales bacterium]